MGLPDFLGPESIIVDIVAEDRWAVIEELIGHLVTAGEIKVKHRDAIAQKIKGRELGASTGIGFGLAIPHAVTNLVGAVVGVVGRSRKGIQFDAADGKPVHVVILFLTPAGQWQEHVSFLADIAKKVHQKDFRERLGL